MCKYGYTDSLSYPRYFISKFMTWVVSKDVPLRHPGAKGERKYSSYSFSTSALYRGKWPASDRGRALPSEKGPPVTIW
jgi:hypothetical protein